MEDRCKVSKTTRGKETIDGHPCEKCKVTVTGQKGEAREALAWYASDLKGFPIQIQMTEKDTAVAMLFRDVKLAKPAAALFDAPQDFTKHGSVQQLMQAAMMKAFSGGKQAGRRVGLGVPAEPREGEAHVRHMRRRDGDIAPYQFKPEIRNSIRISRTSTKRVGVPFPSQNLRVCPAETGSLSAELSRLDASPGAG